MKSKFKTVLVAVALVVIAFALVGCANTLMGEGGPEPAESIYGAWMPSGMTSTDADVVYLYASGRAKMGDTMYNWRVDPEATDPSRLILVDYNGEQTIRAFTYEDDKLSLYESNNASGSKIVYKRDTHKSSPASYTMPPFVEAEAEASH